MNDDIYRAAQDDPEWVVWSSQEQVSRQIDRLFTETFPRVPADWKTRTGSAEPIGPMPVGVDRYSDAMALHWVDHAFDYFLPDEDSVFEPENSQIVDQFTCYIGEYFVRHCNGRWVNDLEARILHRLGPTIRYDWTSTVDFPLNLIFDAAEGDDHRFACVTSAWYSRSVDYAKAHGLPHEHLDLERKLGLS